MPRETPGGSRTWEGAKHRERNKIPGTGVMGGSRNGGRPSWGARCLRHVEQNQELYPGCRKAPGRLNFICHCRDIFSCGDCCLGVDLYRDSEARDTALKHAVSLSTSTSWKGCICDKFLAHSWRCCEDSLFGRTPTPMPLRRRVLPHGPSTCRGHRWAGSGG